jgi:hypothetical protein
MVIRLGCAAVAPRWSSYRIHAAAATRVLTGALNLAQTSQLSYFAKIVLFFSSAISNI